ncbi:ATP-binding protein [Streptomyces mashuensis]|uniref:ATP-binding protein n=1 Tax=Streptomyces mashuensis TaxID=33904 RepID=A0A919E8M8_9ACTN|nr:ATP-binding protein [Streptomyces mashuensis]GHF25591.1 ATP-binding protein [Streptomyces mashuensis]
MRRRTAHWAGTDEDEKDAGPSEPYWERRLRPKDLAAVAEVRAGLRELLARWGAPGRARTAELLASELVTNALVHTDGAAVVSARLTGGAAAPAKGRLRVEVRDFLSRHPTLRPVPAAGCDSGPGPADEARIAATSGRGLVLVHALADVWGVRTHAVGKSVWFELDAQEP